MTEKLCKRCGNIKRHCAKGLCKNCYQFVFMKERIRINHNKFRRNIKLKVITHYSPKLKCIECGFSDMRALQIDHINGGGTKHIKQIKYRLYEWLIENNFPDGFQVLCANCNRIKIFKCSEF